MSENEQARTMEYVVQVQKDYTPDGWLGDAADQVLAWIDVATVSVPLKTNRSTVIKAALAQAGLKPAGESLRLRVLDVKSAAVTEAKPDAPEPQWELS